MLLGRQRLVPEEDHAVLGEGALNLAPLAVAHRLEIDAQNLGAAAAGPGYPGPAAQRRLASRDTNKTLLASHGLRALERRRSVERRHPLLLRRLLALLP